MTWGQTERRWKDQAHQTNGHPQHHLTVLNTVLHGWIDSQLKNTFLLGYSLIMSTIKWLVRGWTKKGRENKGRAWLSACQQQSRPYSSIDHKEKVCCVWVCVCAAPCKHQLPVDLLVRLADKTERQRRAGGADGSKIKWTKRARKLQNRLKTLITVTQ